MRLLAWTSKEGGTILHRPRFDRVKIGKSVLVVEPRASRLLSGHWPAVDGAVNPPLLVTPQASSRAHRRCRPGG
jgi:hypothetical protein